MSIRPQSPDTSWARSFFTPSLLETPGFHKDAPDVAIKLDQNESPFDWPAELKAKVIKTVQESAWNRYPSAYPSDLEAAIAEYTGVDRASVVLTPGSNRMVCTLLNLFGRNVEQRGGKLYTASPSFALYQAHCRYEGIPYQNWQLDEQLQYNPNALDDIPDHSVVIFASPNNPVGNTLKRRDFESLLKKHPKTLWIADEAYHEFTDESYTELFQNYSNFVSIRTFSKTLGSANLRLGYVIAAPEWIEQIRKVCLPFAVNTFTHAAGLTMVQDGSQQLKEQVHAVTTEREALAAALASVSGSATKIRFEIIPSEANFLLIRCESQDNCQQLYKGLIERSILVRNVSRGPGLEGCLRITIGTAQENQAVAEAVGEIV